MTASIFPYVISRAKLIVGNISRMIWKSKFLKFSLAMGSGAFSNSIFYLLVPNKDSKYLLNFFLLSWVRSHIKKKQFFSENININKNQF